MQPLASSIQLENFAEDHKDAIQLWQDLINRIS